MFHSQKYSVFGRLGTVFNRNRKFLALPIDVVWNFSAINGTRTSEFPKIAH